MPAPVISTKRLQINKTNASVVSILCVAVIVTSFALISAFSLFKQSLYQGKVIKEQKAARNVAVSNLANSKKLVASYETFDNEPVNVIKGSKDGSVANAGSNTKIVLDALPSEYDFPALVTSLEKVLNERKFKIESISGTDAPETAVAPGANPQPVEIPFQLSVRGSYSATKDLMISLEKTIRPISISSLELSGNDASILLSINAKTYYQPGKTLNVETKVVQ